MRQSRWSVAVRRGKIRCPVWLEVRAGATGAPKRCSRFERNRCSTGRSGALVKIKSAVRTHAGTHSDLFHRGNDRTRNVRIRSRGRDSRRKARQLPRSAISGAAAAAAAKLAIGRAPISAWRIASRAKSCTNCDRRKRTSIFAGCTFTSTSSYGISRKSSVAGKTARRQECCGTLREWRARSSGRAPAGGSQKRRCRCGSAAALQAGT